MVTFFREYELKYCVSQFTFILLLRLLKHVAHIMCRCILLQRLVKHKRASAYPPSHPFFHPYPLSACSCHIHGLPPYFYFPLSYPLKRLRDAVAVVSTPNCKYDVPGSNPAEQSARSSLSCSSVVRVLVDRRYLVKPREGKLWFTSVPQ